MTSQSREIVGPPFFFRPLPVRRRTLRRCAPPAPLARDIKATNERSGRARCARVASPPWPEASALAVRASFPTYRILSPHLACSQVTPIQSIRRDAPRATRRADPPRCPGLSTRPARAGPRCWPVDGPPVAARHDRSCNGDDGRAGSSATRRTGRRRGRQAEADSLGRRTAAARAVCARPRRDDLAGRAHPLVAQHDNSQSTSAGAAHQQWRTSWHLTARKSTTKESSYETVCSPACAVPRNGR